MLGGLFGTSKRKKGEGSTRYKNRLKKEKHGEGEGLDRLDQEEEETVNRIGQSKIMSLRKAKHDRLVKQHFFRIKNLRNKKRSVDCRALRLGRIQRSMVFFFEDLLKVFF